MSLAYDKTRCLGQHDSGQDCARMESCQRYTERANRGERTPSEWALCSDKGGAYPFQIRVPVRGEVG